jgi:hypothetical protein
MKMMTTSACFWGKISPLCHENKIQCDSHVKDFFLLNKKNGVKVATFFSTKILNPHFKPYLDNSFLAGCQNIAGSLKFSIFLSHLWPNLPISSCGFCQCGYITKFTKPGKKKTPDFIFIFPKKEFFFSTFGIIMFSMIYRQCFFFGL